MFYTFGPCGTPKYLWNSLGNIEVSVPRGGKADFTPQNTKKQLTSPQMVKFHENTNHFMKFMIFMIWGVKGPGREAGKPGSPDPRIPGSREAGKPRSRSQILDFKGRGEISKGYLNVTGWGEASKRQLDVPPARTIRHGLYGASPFRATAPNFIA